MTEFTGLNKRRVDLWSSGGGTQSTAIAVLILQGKLPKPDLAVIADTEREKESTWGYLEAYTAPALEAVGVPIHRIKKSEWGAPDLLSKTGLDLLMPLYTMTALGDIAKLPTYCSTEWKQRPVRRFATAQYPNADFRVWMGMSADEPRRIKPTAGKWETWYPLAERGITRGRCVQIVREHGWPEPPQSSCWMCPNRRPAQWLTLPDDEIEKSAELETLLQAHDPDVYLHQFGLPIRDAIAATTASNQLALWDTERCDSGYCFV